MEILKTLLDVGSDLGHLYLIFMGLIIIGKIVLAVIANEENSITKISNQEINQIIIGLAAIVLLIVRLHLGLW